MNQLEEQKQKRRAELASIPSNYSRILGRMLGLKISDLHLLLLKTGLSIESFLDEKTLLTADQLIQIVQNTKQISGDEGIGLEIGKQLTLGSHGTTGSLIINSPNVLTALASVKEYLPTRFWFTQLNIESDDNWMTFTIDFDLDLNAATYRCFSEVGAIVLFDVLKFALGRAPEKIEIEFSHSKPSYVARYEDVFGCSMVFDASQYQFRIHRSILQERNILADHESYRLALKQCQALLAGINTDDKLYKSKVQKMLLSQTVGSLSVDEAAANLFMSRRTLARKLLNEGVTFFQIKEDILSQQAASYLRETNLSTEAIAAMLNYHDSSSFRRTFKRWFDLTPSEFRQKYQND